MIRIQDSKGHKYTLDDSKQMGSGGEGMVISLNNGLCAKLYFKASDALSQTKIDELSPLDGKLFVKPQIAVTGDYNGYIMEELNLTDYYPIYSLYSPMFANKKKCKHMKGSSNVTKFKRFQIRWAEKLGYEDNPYLIRWTFLFFGYSIRIHHWIKSDDNRFFHDHSADLLSIVLNGRYWNVKPENENENPNWGENSYGVRPNEKHCYVEGIFNSWHNFFHMNRSIWFSKAEDRHYLKIPKGGAWTLMFEGRPRHKWGFYVNGHKWRPLRYFHKYGIRQDEEYQ